MLKAKRKYIFLLFNLKSAFMYTNICIYCPILKECICKLGKKSTEFSLHFLLIKKRTTFTIRILFSVHLLFNSLILDFVYHQQLHCSSLCQLNICSVFIENIYTTQVEHIPLKLFQVAEVKMKNKNS